MYFTRLALWVTLNLQKNLVELVAAFNSIMAKATALQQEKGQPLKRSPLCIFLINELK